MNIHVRVVIPLIKPIYTTTYAMFTPCPSKSFAVIRLDRLILVLLCFEHEGLTNFDDVCNGLENL